MLNSKVRIKNLELRNRLVLPPITTNYGSPEGLVTENILHFYRERSRDIGLTIVESTSVHPGGRTASNGLGLWDDDQIPGMKSLVNTIRKQGAMAVVQLNHAGPACFPRKILRQGFSPSGVAFRPDVEPIIMDTNDIDQLTSDFSAAAVRASKAGFNAVEIHGAHLYLLSQFLSPLTNSRDDIYGGDVKGRAAVAIKTVKKIREALSPDFPIFFRINAVEKIDGGLTFEDALIIGKLLADAGVDVFDVSLIAQGGWKKIEDKKYLTGTSVLPKEEPPGANTAFTAAFKKEVRRPVIVVGKFGAGNAAAQAVENEQIDMVAIGRQMICDPQSAGKILNGADNEIIPCEECLKCFAALRKGSPLGCRVNENLPNQKKAGIDTYSSAWKADTANNMTFAEKVINFNSNLDLTAALPENIRVMNPFKENTAAQEISSTFYKKYYNDHEPRRLILGINPGRFGAGVTGIPFTDTKRLEDKCGIKPFGVTTHETSSVFVYDVIEQYGGVEKFYGRFYINSVSPLGFVKSKKNGKEVNFNYYDSKALQELITPFIIESLKKQISFGIDRDIVYSFGAGKNLKFLQTLNQEHHFFDQIVPLEHPRYIMQYRSKQKQFYIDKYINAFNKFRTSDIRP